MGREVVGVRGREGRRGEELRPLGETGYVYLKRGRRG